jgi:hypothetical protein
MKNNLQEMNECSSKLKASKTQMDRFSNLIPRYIPKVVED